MKVFYGSTGSSAKINFYFEDEEKIEGDYFWPEGVECRKWVSKEEWLKERGPRREYRPRGYFNNNNSGRQYDARDRQHDASERQYDVSGRQYDGRDKRDSYDRYDYDKDRNQRSGTTSFWSQPDSYYGNDDNEHGY